MQALVSGDANSDAGAGYGRTIVLCIKLLHLAHTLVPAQNVRKVRELRDDGDARAVARRPEKVKVIKQQLLNMNLAAFVPSPRLSFARVESRQQKRVRKPARNPGYPQHVAVANINGNSPCVCVTVPKLPEVVAPPRPDAAVGLHGSHVLAPTAHAQDVTINHWGRERNTRTRR